MFGASYFGKSYFGGAYWGPASGAVVTITHSPYYSEFSEYAISADGEIKQRFPWGRKKSTGRKDEMDRQDEMDIMDILSRIVGKP